MYDIEKFSAWKFFAAALASIALVQALRIVTPAWLITALRYVTTLAGVVCADLLLESSAFR